MRSYLAEIGAGPTSWTVAIAKGSAATAARKFWRMHAGFGQTWPKGVKLTHQDPPRAFFYFKYTAIRDGGRPVKLDREAWLRYMCLQPLRHRI